MVILKPKVVEEKINNKTKIQKIENKQHFIKAKLDFFKKRQFGLISL